MNARLWNKGELFRLSATLGLELWQSKMQKFGRMERCFKFQQIFYKDIDYQRCKGWSKEGSALDFDRPSVVGSTTKEHKKTLGLMWQKRNKVKEDFCKCSVMGSTVKKHEGILEMTWRMTIWSWGNFGRHLVASLVVKEDVTSEVNN